MGVPLSPAPTHPHTAVGSRLTKLGEVEKRHFVALNQEPVSVSIPSRLGTPRLLLPHINIRQTFPEGAAAVLCGTMTRLNIIYLPLAVIPPPNAAFLTARALSG